MTSQKVEYGLCYVCIVNDTYPNQFFIKTTGAAVPDTGVFDGERTQVPVAEQKLQKRKQRWVRLQGDRKRFAAETEEQSVSPAD